MYDHAPTILDQITLVHGPHELLARYFAFADETLREHGVHLRFSQDFARLIALNQEHRESWPPLSPIFNPHYNDLGNGTAFWIEGRDRFGETVVTNGARLYDLGEGSLVDAVESLRVFYDDPAPAIAAGETVKITAPSATGIRGRVAFAGGLWVRPDYRRFGFAKLLPRFTRSFALTSWNTPTFWTYVDQKLDRIGLTQAYGYSHSEERIATRMPTWRGEYDVLFLSQGRDELIAAIAHMLEESTTGSARWMDTHIMKASPPLARQGIRTRS
jgi:GNAT superfamily N-acetyltransferase